MTNDELLTSWNDTPTRAAIVAFVDAATGDGPRAIPPEHRVATFDNDGTLWCEKPMPSQLDFTIRRFAAMAEADAALLDQAEAGGWTVISLEDDWATVFADAT